MLRPTILLALLAAASSVRADDPGNPPSAGARGTVTAWDATRRRVLEHRFCLRVRGGWDYVECGARVREQVQLRLCADGGPRVHRYLLQQGDGSPMPASVSCTK